MLEPETKLDISSMVRTGFYDRDRLIEVFTEEMYAPGELDSNDVVSTIDSEFVLYEEEKLSYPATTDCDRLDTAFNNINERGVIALQNAGYTQSDGYEDINDALSDHPNSKSIIGYCFYHCQDLERAVNGGGLYFAFGPIDPAKEQTDGLKVGEIVRDELVNAGLLVDWDGTFEKRLSVPNLKWQKR